MLPLISDVIYIEKRPKVEEQPAENVIAGRKSQPPSTKGPNVPLTSETSSDGTNRSDSGPTAEELEELSQRGQVYTRGFSSPPLGNASNQSAGGSSSSKLDAKELASELKKP